MAKIEMGCNLKITTNFFKSSCVFEKLKTNKITWHLFIGVLGGIS